MSLLAGVHLVKGGFTFPATANSIHDELCFFVIFHCIEGCTDIGEGFEAAKLDGLTRQNFLDMFPLIINHEAYLALASAAHKHVLRPQCALLNKDSGRYLRRLLIEIRFYHEALGLARDVLLQFQLGLRYFDDLLLQNVQVDALFRGDWYTDDISTELLWDQVMAGQV